MCGIAGSCNFTGKRVDETAVKQMIQTLVHRGPDDEGIYISAQKYPNAQAQVGLGHSRLSIIDLNTGHQPMSNEDNSVWIVFNGEIYNFSELRERLLKKGHRFKTKSDTEVILHLYEDQDLDCLRNLRGMFAFAIWDNKKERLFLARDRVGKKPLVYHFDGQNFIFASEIKALLQNNIKRKIDFSSIDYFLTYGYIPSPQSILKGIKKLPPAHILTYDKGGLKTQRYWRLTYKKSRISFTESKERLGALLTESVKLRLIGDVPVGAFLSGGMDSSAIVALMSGLYNARVKTFTIGFEEQDYSELKFAQKIAKRFNTDHHEFIVKPDALKVLNKLVWHYNEPFGDASSIPTYYVAKMTRQFVPVALNGDGGDESFAGYPRYAGLKISGYLESFPQPLISGLYTICQMNIGFLNKMVFFLMRRMKIHPRPRYIEGVLTGLINYSNEWNRYISWLSCFQKEQREDLYSDFFKDRLNNDTSPYILNLVETLSAHSLVEKALEIDVNTYLPEDLLVKMDIATMANSLEARSPFLDHKLMEFTASLPIEFKMRFLSPKYILKELMRDLLPKEILKRKKMGFGVPLDKWFRKELKQFSYDTLLDKKCIGRGYFKKERITALLDEHASGKFNNGARIWSLLNLEIWHRIFIDTSMPQEI